MPPIDWTPLERLGVQFAESMGKDLKAWSEPVELDGVTRFIVTTADGRDVEVQLRAAAEGIDPR